MAASWPVALRELERKERSRGKDSLVRDEMVERKWFEFELRGGQVAHFHTPHIKPPNPSFFFLFKSIPVCRHNITIFLKVFSASKNYGGPMGGCIDIMP